MLSWRASALTGMPRGWRAMISRAWRTWRAVLSVRPDTPRSGPGPSPPASDMRPPPRHLWRSTGEVYPYPDKGNPSGSPHDRQTSRASGASRAGRPERHDPPKAEPVDEVHGHIGGPADARRGVGDQAAPADRLAAEAQDRDHHHGHDQAPGDGGEQGGAGAGAAVAPPQQAEQHAEARRQAEVHAGAGQGGLGLEPEPRAGGRLLHRDVVGGRV